MKKTIAALGLLACTNTFALTIDMNVNIFQKVLFEKLDSNTLLKIHSSVETSATGVVKQDGQTVTVNESEPVQYDRNRDMKLVIKDKHSIRLIDSADGVDEVVTATIDKSWSGKIKKLKIDNKIYESLYNKQLETMGGSIFGQFGIQSDNVAFGFSIKLSDFECAKEYDGLVECMQSLKFNITGSDEVTNEQDAANNNSKAKTEIDSAINVVNSYIGNLNYSTKYDINSYITILKEIRNEIENTANKISNKDVASEISKLSSSINSEMLDSYKYQTAKGKYIDQMFETYLSSLKSIQSKL